MGSTTHYFGPTGANQSFVVPTGAVEIRLELRGARGGNGNSADENAIGKGARVLASYVPIPGATLEIIVGLAGALNTGGWPDGGNSYDLGKRANGGGGSTRVSEAGVLIAVAGAGGGLTSRGVGGFGGASGGGGGETGVSGSPGASGRGGEGATQNIPGTGGAGEDNGSSVEGTGLSGDTLGNGGDGGQFTTGAGVTNQGPGAGGGGGYRGGGGGGAVRNAFSGSGAAGGGGGGGSSYTNLSCYSVSFTNAFQNDHGQVWVTVITLDAVGRQLDVRFRERSTVFDLYVPRWNARSRQFKNFESRFSIQSKVADTFEAKFNETVSATEDVAFLYRGQQLVNRSEEVRWAGFALAGDLFVPTYHVKELASDEFDAKFNESIPVVDESSFKFNTTTPVGKSVGVVYSGYTNYQARTGGRTYTFQSDAEGFNNTRNTTQGNPAASMQVQVEPTGTSNQIAASSKAATLSEIFGIPDGAVISKIRCISMDTRIITASNVANGSTSLRLQNAAGTVHIHVFTQRGQSAAEDAFVAHGGNEYVFPSPVLGTSTDYRLAFVVSAARNVGLLSANYVSLFDNLVIEADYEILVTGKSYTAIYRGAGPVSLNFESPFDVTEVAPKQLQARFSGNAPVGDELTVESNYLATVGRNEDIEFNSTIAAGEEIEILFDSYQNATDSIQTTFNNSELVNEEFTSESSITSSVNEDLEVAYNQSELVAREELFIWDVTGKSTNLVESLWHNSALLFDDVVAVFNNSVLINKDHEFNYSITESVAQAVSAVYSGAANIFRDFAARFNSRSYVIWLWKRGVPPAYDESTTETPVWSEEEATVTNYSEPADSPDSLWTEPDSVTPGFYENESDKAELREEL